MGFLSQLVGAVVDAVDTATGNKNSQAGNAVEQAAAAVEQAASNAADAAAEAAAEAAGFVAVVLETTKSTMTGAISDWVGGTLTDAGIPLPNALDLQGTVNLVVAIGDLTARKAEEKIERIAGPVPIRIGKAAIRGLVLEGPRGVFDAMKGPVLETIDADGQIRDWITRTGGIIEETSPAEAAVRILAAVPNGPAATWEALRDLLGGRESSTRKPGPLTTLANRADHERRRLVEELRRAAAYVECTQPKDAVTSVRVPPPRSSRLPEGAELQRLMRVVAGARRESRPAADPFLAGLVASTTGIALRGALIICCSGSH